MLLQPLVDAYDGPTSISPSLEFSPVTRIFCLIAFPCLLILSGCNSEPPPVKTNPPKNLIGKGPDAQPMGMDGNAPQAEPDDAGAIAALKAAGAKFEKDSAGNVITVNLRDTSATDDVLEHIAALKKIRSLLLNELQITKKGLAHLAEGKPPLLNLDLRGCPVDNAALAHISELTTLKAVRLNGVSGATTVDDGGMKHLKGLVNLKVLALDGLWVSEIGLEELTNLKKIEELYLKSTTVSDDGLALLSNYPKLKKLRLAFGQISDAGLPHLSGIKTLEELDLSENSSLTNVGLEHLAPLTSLRKLNLWRLAISDDGIKNLAPLTNLEWLNLDNTQLSDAGLVALKDMKALTFLHLGSTSVSDTGLAQLEHLTNLKDLKVTRTPVTAEGVAQLQPKLPDTKIQLEYVEGQ